MASDAPICHVVSDTETTPSPLSLSHLSPTALPVTAVVGAQWGDEGKGKAVDYFCSTGAYACAARCAGGPNAAHTIVVPDGTGGTKRCVLRMVPSGVLNDGVTCVIGQGVVVDIDMLVDEMSALGRGHGVDCAGRVRLSDRAHLLFDLHRALDAHGERAAAAHGAAIGTTRRGVGPCYTDKVARRGLRVADLTQRRRFVSRMRSLLVYHANAHPAAVRQVFAARGIIVHGDGAVATGAIDAAVEMYATEYVDGHYASVLADIVCDAVDLLAARIDRQERVLVECSQATMLDIDQGTYPHVTSSTTTAAGAAIGLGLPPRLVGAVGVTKAYVTRVVSHPDARAGCPFPTRLPDLHVASDSVITHLTAQASAAGSLASADLPSEAVGVLGVPPGVYWDAADLAAARAMSVIGREMDGSGRPRAVGWFDAVVARHAHVVNAFDALVLNKLDVFSGLGTLKIATAYRMRDGTTTERLPEDLDDVAGPLYGCFAGWREDIGACATFDDLPAATRVFVRAIEGAVGCRVGWVGVGPARHQMLAVPPADRDVC